MLAIVSTLSARNLPSLSSASSAWVTWSRPWQSVMERLAALGRPLDRPADARRRPADHRLVGVAEDLAAEAAADVRRDDAQLVLGNAEHEGRQDEAQHVRVLRGRPERVVAGALVVLRRRRARLHGVGDQAVVDEVDLGDVRGLGERRIDIGLHADFPVVDQVARRLGDGPAARPCRAPWRDRRWPAAPRSRP